MVEEIRERVRARYPEGDAGGIGLPDLMPLFHARDAAEAKVASIGMVNPRAGGLKNSIIQSVKRLIARALDWHVREQVEFNRGVMSCVEATLEVLKDVQRALAAAGDMVALRRHWEGKMLAHETALLRGSAELQSAYQQRTAMLEQAYRDLVKAQHRDFERTAAEMQQRIRMETDAMIHSELRVLRQRMAFRGAPDVLANQPVPGPAPSEFDIDWLRHAERFRGSEENIKERQRMYATRFAGCRNVLDLGCGRGELLAVLQQAGIRATGIELNDELIEICRQKSFEAEKADLFQYLASLGDNTLDGIVCSQVVEHLPPERLPELARLAQAKLSHGGLLAIETPNPESLAIFATHFYLDPTHRHPLPPALMMFYLEEAGFGAIEVERLNPAVESMPSVGELPEGFRNAFFGALDYAIFGRKLT